MPVDLDEHRRLDAAAMAKQAPERYPWKWDHPAEDGRFQVWISPEDAALIVAMRNDHMVMIEEIDELRADVDRERYASMMSCQLWRCD